MRLDHLLSREIRVPAHGGVGALMALRLIARPIVSPRQVGSGAAGNGIAGRFATWQDTETRSSIRLEALCHSSRVKALPALPPDDPVSCRVVCASGEPQAPAGV